METYRPCVFYYGCRYNPGENFCTKYKGLCALRKGKIRRLEQVAEEEMAKKDSEQKSQGGTN